MSESPKGLINGFKEFIAQGNAMEMAVGVVIAGAFSAIISSVVDGIINPLIAGLVGKPDFNDVLAFSLGASTIKPGMLITACINFLLIALAVYLCIIVPMNKIRSLHKAKEEEAPEEVPADIQLLTEIRDSLKQQNRQ